MQKSCLRLSVLLVPALLLFFWWAYPRVEHPYAVAKGPTPVLYTRYFPRVFGWRDGASLKFDDYGEIDELEFVALPGTVFTIQQEIRLGGRLIYRIEAEDYPYPTERGYYIDARFVEAMDDKPAERARSLPSEKEIMDRLLTASGSMYTWGGNRNAGIPELLSLYEPDVEIDPLLREQWMLAGVDCSGLLYEATDGVTPRNTSSLVSYGEPVEIEGLDAAAIAKKLQPLDLIAWKGHVIIVLEDGKTIESRLDYDDEAEGFQGGVRVRTVDEVLEQTMETRTPVDDYDAPAPEEQKNFVVRRWYGRQ